MLHYRDFQSGDLRDSDDDYLCDWTDECDRGSIDWRTGLTLNDTSNSWLVSCPGDTADDLEFRAYFREVYEWGDLIGSFDAVDWSKGGKQWNLP